LHYRELRFPPTLPAARQRGRAAARDRRRQTGRQGLCHHRTSRVDDSAARRRSDREAFMSDEQPYHVEPAEPVPAPESPPGHEPFWTYFDLAVFAGLALPCILLGFGAVKLLFWALHFQPQNKILELLPGQALGYLLL